MVFRIGHTSRIDYKSYQRPYTYNRGDHSIIVATAQQLKKIESNCKVITIDWEKLNTVGLTKKDKVLVCGSGYFFPNPEGKFPKRLNEDLRAIDESGAELHLLGVGYNYLLDWTSTDLPAESRELLHNLLAKATTLTVRDESTKQFLSEFTNRQIAVIGDPALFIETSQFSEQAKIANTHPKIGINIPFHGHEPTLWIRSHLIQFTEILKNIQKTTNSDFTYFVHYDSEILIAELIKDQGIPIKIIDQDASKLPREYAKMDIHIGGMLHSCILATAASTPCIGLAYDKKHQGFFELMKRPNYCINANPFNAEELLKKSIHLLNNLSNEKILIAKRKHELASDFIMTLKGIVTPLS